jgi:DNA end-binding protein Ku
MAHAIWKGHLSFGLITIPLSLHAAARGERISFNQLHKECKSRVKQPLFCPTCERMVERGEIIKGFEYETGQYVLFDEKDFEKVAPPSSKTMEILEFVKLDEIDPIFLDASYFTLPEEAGEKAYFLLTRTMEECGYAAVAKLTMHQREHIVIIRPHGKGLTLHTMYYKDEIRAVAEYGRDTKAKPKDQEIKLAHQLIESLAGEFEPEKYRDEFRVQMREMIEAKKQGREIAAAPEVRLAPVIDLMEALKKSLESAPKKQPARLLAVEEKKVARRKAR